MEETTQELVLTRSGWKDNNIKKNLSYDGVL